MATDRAGSVEPEANLPPFLQPPRTALAGPVLGLETSCDETAVAVVHHRQVLTSRVATQIPLHARFGGVVPEVAARSHLLTVLPTLAQALADAGLQGQQLGGIAVTHRPGLIGALLVGVQTAKALAMAWQLPLIGVDHIAAHIWASQLIPPGPVERDWQAPALPFAALAVSGGHTSLYRVDGPDQLTLLGRTLDDAAGEAFDKVGKLMGLDYPAGPVVDRLAADGDPTRFALNKGMTGRTDGAYSFSGIKTAMRLQWQALHASGTPTEQDRADLCAALQHAIVEQLARVTLQSMQRGGLDRLVVAGGVAANRALRSHLTAVCGRAGIAVFPVAPAYCTDNAAMVAGLGEALLLAGHRDDPHMLDALPTGQVRRSTAPQGS